MRPAQRVDAGATGAPRTVGPISQTDIVRFAGAGGDFNPLHHDPDFVRSTGFPGVIAMGQLQAGMLAAYVSDWFGIEHLREFEVRFVAAVFIGDVLTMSGEVDTIDTTGPDHIAVVRVVASRGDEPVVTGTARVVVAG